jgi:hypothetical protein
VARTNPPRVAHLVLERRSMISPGLSTGLPKGVSGAQGPVVVADSVGAVSREATRARDTGRLRLLLERDALLVVALASFASALTLRLVGQVNQDAWLALAAGREIGSHGVPGHEGWTVWAHGARWIDQQWLGQLVLYWLHALGGLRLVLAAHALLTAGAYALAVALARRRGATPLQVLVLLPPCLWLFIFGSWQLRTQSFSYLLFSAVLWLLATRPFSWRLVALLAGLLALWANLHGAVVLGAALVMLRGLVELGRRRLAGLALVVLPLVLLVSPYGLELVSYYRSTLLNPLFGAFVNEWQPPTLGVQTLPFYALLAIAAAVWRRLDRFELLALAATGVAGLRAERNIVWFAFAALILLPRALEIRQAQGSRSRSALNANLALVALAGLGAALAGTLAKPTTAFQTAYPAAAADAVVAAHPARVFADVKYADWLMWREPQLRGRVAYDARFELLTRAQLVRIYGFAQPYSDAWQRASAGYDVLVLDAQADRWPVRALLKQRGVRVLYRDAGLVVASRRPPQPR